MQAMNGTLLIKKNAYITKYKGLYDSEIECTSDRYSLDSDEVYLGCKK